MIQKYVVGLIILPYERQAVLIQKQKPLWQKGLFNGIGGKIETYDPNPESAMVRECFEETDVIIPFEDWHRQEHLVGAGFELFAFSSVYKQSSSNFKTKENELVIVQPWSFIQLNPDRCVDGIPELLELAIKYHKIHD